jgi:hypothetical protein
VYGEPMTFQSLAEMVKLVNASTHQIDKIMSSPLGRHRILVEPLGVVEVPRDWTERGFDRHGQKTVRSTVEQELPFLVDSKHPNVALAKKAMEKGEVFPPVQKAPEVSQHSAPATR